MPKIYTIKERLKDQIRQLQSDNDELFPNFQYSHTQPLSLTKYDHDESIDNLGKKECFQ